MSVPKQIRRVPNITYDEFRGQHLLPNQPLLIGPALIQDWNCLKDWRSPQTSSDSNASHEQSSEYSLPNLSFMKNTYGKFIVPVDQDGYRSEKTLGEVIDAWENDRKSAQEEKMYVKDWHLALQLERQQQRPQSNGEGEQEEQTTVYMPFYVTPDIFVDDWMN
ncbi:4258_t:CDS:1, partial [Acaulospora colombiana]